MRSEITEQELREIGRRVPVPDGHSVKYFASDPPHRPAARAVLCRDGYRPKEVRAAVTASGDPDYAYGWQAFDWTAAMLAAIDEARAKPALVELPDVSDLDGVTLRQGVDGVAVSLTIAAVTQQLLLRRVPGGPWHPASIYQEDVRYFAGIVAERLNQQEQDR